MADEDKALLDEHSKENAKLCEIRIRNVDRTLQDARGEEKQRYVRLEY